MENIFTLNFSLAKTTEASSAAAAVPLNQVLEKQIWAR